MPKNVNGLIKRPVRCRKLALLLVGEAEQRPGSS